NVSAPASAAGGTAFSFTVTAQDQFNNTATSYGGTVHFSTTDGQAVLPANSTLTNGVGTFSATLETAGSQPITATDTVFSSITGTLNNVLDSQNNTGNVDATMGVLIGDTSADRSVNSADISQTKSQSGHAVSISNFREDVTADGSLNSADISLVKSKSGTALP